MRTSIIGLALAAALGRVPSLPAQDMMPGMASHHTSAAVDLILANSDSLRLTPAQVDSFGALKVLFAPARSRMVVVGMDHPSSKTHVPRFGRVNLPASRFQHRVVTSRVVLLSRDRVPGKSVPRIGRVVRVESLPCPFGFLAFDQMRQVHALLDPMGHMN